MESKRAGFDTTVVYEDVVGSTDQRSLHGQDSFERMVLKFKRARSTVRRLYY